ncbi:MAG: hypothetical protein UT27_C0020G0006 [Candidatus Nomurabacteria bacterium GW2011_GWD2_39_12]|uniref:Uncharacterized protein n=1 Tax=Candidatus Nomurabacteria bacterium GW2011_GWD2_39_12 TaxID=1618759 RepID=A0A837HX49_9BACT|nr:MAG: hypothetical protein UT27_C0020G0006 [Candidatus Nomurabacteria bacterium GW2011_GWD2_39_12]
MGLLNGTKWGQPPFFFALPSESALKPRHTARILGGQNPKKKNVLSILEKTTPAKTKSIAEWSEVVVGLSWSVQFNLELPRAPRVRHHLF